MSDRSEERPAGLGVAARLARREVRRRPWRSFLVALLVAVPVAGMTVAVVFLRTNQLTAMEEWRLSNGAADAIVGSQPAGLPPGSRVVSYRTDPHRLIRTADGRRTSGQILNLPLDDPLTAGIVRMQGRPPTSAGEVVLSAHAARRLGVGLGDTIDLERPLVATVSVVGIGELASWHDAGFLILHPSAPFPTRAQEEPTTTQLVDLPPGLSPDQTRSWASETGAASLSPDLAEQVGLGVREEDAGAESIRWSWIGGAAALTVMGIVIASAFAAGARRQLTTLGQLSANGASPRMLRRVLVLQGSWTGLVGAGLGLGLGAAALGALAPHRDKLLGRYVSSYRVEAGDLVPVVLLGVLAATVAALVPARSASRVPVTAALAGRRPLGAVPPWLPVTGVAVSGGGLGLLALSMLGARDSGSGNSVWVLLGMMGAIALLLGVCAVAPGYVSVLGPVASRLGGSFRLAARSLARQRSRTGAVVSAVCATAALAMSWSAIGNAALARDEELRMPADRVFVLTGAVKPHSGPPAGPVAIESPPPELVDRLLEVLPGAEVYQRWWVRLPGEGGVASVADARFLEDLGIKGGDRIALARAGVAVLGNARVVPRPAGGDRAPVTVQPPRIESTRRAVGPVPPVLVTPERVAELGLTPEAAGVVLHHRADLTAGERDAVEGVFEDWSDEHQRRARSAGLEPTPFTIVDLARPTGGPSPLVLDAILAGVSFVFVLFVVASSLALAGAETRAERDVLTMVGASPKTIRRTSGVKAAVLTSLGVLLALPVGLLPVYAFTRINPADLPFVVPWRALAFLLVGLPLAAAALTTGASALALRLRPIRTSTIAFE